MISIKDGRIWFYSEDGNAELPTLDFELISAYTCPECKSILSAYFIGTIPETLIERYWETSSRKYQTGSTKGGSYIIQTDHGGKIYNAGSNCSYKTATGRGIGASLKALAGLGPLHSTEMLNSFVKDIESGEMEDTGLAIATDICETDAPILLYDADKICSDYYEYEFEKEEHLGEELKKLIETSYARTRKIERDETQQEPSQAVGSVLHNVLGYTRLGGKKRKIKLAQGQATLF